jgi:hypothetical protein
MDQYIEYIEKTLHVTANASLYNHLDTLPLYLRNVYELFVLTIQHVQCLLARPKEPANLTVLRKQSVQLKKLTGLDCVLCLEGARIYTKEKMLAEGIPFVIVGQQVYMPFLGVALSRNGVRGTERPEHIAFITQKLLLTAIYQSWARITLTEAATKMGVSKMTITRCFDELVALDLPLIKTEGKMRRFLWSGSRRALWEIIRPVLRVPISRQYQFGVQSEIEHAKLGGMSARSHYSRLSDNAHRVYAVSKEATKTLELGKLPMVPEGEDPEMVVQVMPYDLEYGGSVAVDPLTAILSLTDKETADPRVEAAIDEILEGSLP